MLQATDRGYDGRVARLTTLADESYNGFIQSFRNLTLGQLAPRGRPEVQEALEQAGIGPIATDDDLPRVHAAIDHLPSVQLWKRSMRSHQQAMWARTVQSIYRRRDELMAELDAYDKKGPGSVEYTMGTDVPEYTKCEIHLMPGGYIEDPLIGYIYHYGTKVFFQGGNDKDDIQSHGAQIVPTPADGKVERVLDMGCSIGQTTTALKERFPDAEVTGIDVGAPMIRYGHKRAVDLGIDVHFRQMLAEKTDYPDNHFDIVTALIMFHEVPVDKQKEIIREAFRILRPGGVFMAVDFPNTKDGAPTIMKYFMEFDSTDNCEPYSLDFMASDFAGNFAEAGFEVERGTEKLFNFLDPTYGVKPVA